MRLDCDAFLSCAIAARLLDRCEVVFDGGPSPVPPLGSTVIDLSVAGRFSLLRRGVDHEHYVGILSSRWGLTFYQ